MRDQELFQDARQAIERYVADCGLSHSGLLDGLQDLREVIDGLAGPFANLACRHWPRDHN